MYQAAKLRHKLKFRMDFRDDRAQEQRLSVWSCSLKSSCRAVIQPEGSYDNVGFAIRAFAVNHNLIIINLYVSHAALDYLYTSFFCQGEKVVLCQNSAGSLYGKTAGRKTTLGPSKFSARSHSGNHKGRAGSRSGLPATISQPPLLGTGIFL